MKWALIFAVAWVTPAFVYLARYLLDSRRSYKTDRARMWQQVEEITRGRNQ